MKQRTAATASERQAKYRRSRGLSAVFLSEATREAINALQVRTGLKKELLVARAMQSLMAELDREERRRAGASVRGSSRRAARPGGKSEPADASSLSHKKSPPSSATPGERPPGSTDLATKGSSRVRGGRGRRGGESQADQPNLFDDLTPRR
ncbi:hypothetical protein [Roseomonas sp. HF4]|uniref:hypothetical protein n=1 Tax=Roseomonas sp. HF4 TaxID=2562313 RepID=UPI0010C140C4|nr:hypothetical protein [Roseomonas sp. HF4]